MVKPLKILVFLSCCSFMLNAQMILKGKIVEPDSVTALPFVYVINKSNGNGTMSDNEGRFSLNTNANDTVICSYVGYAKLFIPVKALKADEKGEVKLVMNRMLVNLNAVTVSTFKIKPYERDYMKKIIDESKMRPLDYAGSPITALYMQFSKEGKQIRKLAKIFEQIFVDEEVQKKLSPEILKKLTGDENIDYAAFRRYCVGASDQYIMSHEGAELYTKVMDCYKRWKREGR
jgi:hypothetical protein